MDDLKDRLQRMSKVGGRPPPIMKTLGMELVAAGRGRASLKLRVGRRFHNPMGTVHGGVMTDLADAAMGIAVMTTL
ncbi:MAG TPA: PaaI family thioesterase, partial [Nitrososphaerales archaeon]|nr:PaaI family thioesterase [Nitrososphaerales archaeon]